MRNLSFLVICVVVLCSSLVRGEELSARDEVIQKTLETIMARLDAMEKSIKELQESTKLQSAEGGKEPAEKNGDKPSVPAQESTEPDLEGHPDQKLVKDKLIDWTYVQKLIGQIQAAGVKRQPGLIIKLADALIREVRDNDKAYIAVSKDFDLTMGITPHIVGDASFAINLAKPFKRMSKDRKLDMTITGVGVVYTGKNEDIDVIDVAGRDYRLPNAGGNEIYATDGKMKIRKDLKPTKEARGKFYEARKKSDSVSRKAFVHFSRDEADLGVHAAEHGFKVVLADHDDDSFIVRSVLEHDGESWKVVYGNPRSCVECMTDELREFIRDAARK